MVDGNKDNVLCIVGRIGTHPTLVFWIVLKRIKQFLVVLDDVDAVLVAVGEPVLLRGVSTLFYLVRPDNRRGVRIVLDATGLEFHEDSLALVRVIKGSITAVGIQWLGEEVA